MSKHEKDQLDDVRIELTAAVWQNLRDRGMNADEAAGFIRWLQQDPRHALAFAEIDRVAKAVDRLAALQRPQNPGLGGVETAEAGRHSAKAFRRPRILVSVAVAAAVMLGIFLQSRRPMVVETPVGGVQTLALKDGSTVQLNTASTVRPRYTGTERRIELVQGEAFFSVAKEPSRPFVVVVGPVSVRAVGTAFNVQRHEHALEILVIEGRVAVTEQRRGRSLLAGPGTDAVLAAGQRALLPWPANEPEPVTSAAEITELSPAELVRSLAWQERRLEFDGAPLSRIVHEFNRYNDRKLVVVDPQLAARRFTGTFRTDGYESFVRLLEQDFGVTTTHGNREIVLSASN